MTNFGCIRSNVHIFQLADFSCSFHNFTPTPMSDKPCLIFQDGFGGWVSRKEGDESKSGRWVSELPSDDLGVEVNFLEPIHMLASFWLCRCRRSLGTRRPRHVAMMSMSLYMTIYIHKQRHIKGSTVTLFVFDYTQITSSLASLCKMGE